MIKYFCCFTFFVCEAALAVTTPAKLTYFENTPGNKQRLLFKIDKSCSTQDSPLVEVFYSHKKYQSAETGKITPVRVVHLYAKTNAQSCKFENEKTVEKIFEIPISKMMSHIFITSDPDIEVQSFQ